MTFSIIASNRKIDNTPDIEQTKNIKNLVVNVLQPVRDLYGKSIFINSGFRSKKLNDIVKGAKNSQHLEGKAVDITAGSITENKKLFDLIKNSKIPFDQLIDEYDCRWVHVSYNEGKNRREILHVK